MAERALISSANYKAQHTFLAYLCR